MPKDTAPEEPPGGAAQAFLAKNGERFKKSAFKVIINRSFVNFMMII
jgi:hypothetical protein